MSWEDQGRQYHMWFGHGTTSDRAAKTLTGGGGANLASKLAYGAIASLPPAQRRQAESQLHTGTLEHLGAALPIWMRSAHLDSETFAERFFGRDASDAAAGNLHAAVIAASLAPGNAAMRGASEKFGDAMAAVGLSRWPRFVADAQARAELVAELKLEDVTPVPFKDDHGNLILNRNGDPMLRPAGMDPHFFVEQGLRDRDHEYALMAGGGEAGRQDALGFRMMSLSNFGRGGAWDAQRVGGSYRPEFIDYATVAIGLYAAANSIPKSDILSIENIVAIGSKFKEDEEKDRTYTFLPVRNVKNTDIGYELYQSGRISMSGSSR